MLDSNLATSLIERSMLRVRRGMSRRTLGQLLTSQIRPTISLAVLSVIDTVEQGADDDGDVVTVGTVAARMAVDPSRASRVVSEAIGQGYIRRVACQEDGRRTGLELTPAAGRVTRQAHTIRQEYYRRLMSGWSDDERIQFAELLSRFTAAMHTAV